MATKILSKCSVSNPLCLMCLTAIIAPEKAPAPVVVSVADKTKQKKRVKKDKDAPKKPMSPFFCYQGVRRAALKAEQPTLNNTEIIKVSNLCAIN